MTKAPAPPTLTKDLLGSALPGLGASYKLAQFAPGQVGFGVAVAFDDAAAFVDEAKMAIAIPYASGLRRDGVGDLLEVEGIDFSRHVQNPAHLWNHQKDQLPLGMVQDPETGQYTGTVDVAKKLATDLVYFYRGKGLTGVDRTVEKDHALFCEQVFDLLVKKFLRSGSIGYQVIEARPLPADPSTGTPTGYHLLRVLKLESSTVVLPANADTVRKLLDLPVICGKPPADRLVKSLQPLAPERKAMANGIGPGETTQVPVPLKDVPDTQIPHSKWKPGAGAIKNIRQKYRKKSISWQNNAADFVPVRNSDLPRLKDEGRRLNLRIVNVLDLEPETTEPASFVHVERSYGDRNDRNADIRQLVQQFALSSGNVNRRLAKPYDRYDGKAFFEKRDEADDKIYRLGIRPTRYSAEGTEFATHDDAMRAYNVYVDFGIPVRTVNPTTLKVGGKSMGTKGSQAGGPRLFRWENGHVIELFDDQHNRDLRLQELKQQGHRVFLLDREGKFGVRYEDQTPGRKAVQKGIKSIRVKYRNRVVKGFANVEVAFDTSKLTTDQLDAFAKDMAACGFGKPAGGRWSDGENAKLLSPMKKACFTADLEPGKAVHEALAKAHAVAARHRVKLLGDAGQQAEPTPAATGTPINGTKNMKAKGKSIDGLAKEQAIRNTIAKYIRKGGWKNEAVKEAIVWLQPNEKDRRTDIEAFAEEEYNNAGLDDRGRKKSMTAKAKTAPKYRRKDAESAAVDAAEGAAAAEDVPVEPEADDAPVEKPGAEVLRKIHEHHLILMQDYDEALQVMENEKVKAHLEAILEDIEAKLQETEDLFADEYPDAEPLEGADDVDATDDDSEMADSGEEDLPPPGEVVEAMAEGDGYGSEGEKRFRGKRFKGTTRYQRKHVRKSGRKGLCPACGADGGMNADSGYEPTPDGIPGPDQNAGDSGVKYIKQLTQDDVGIIGGSSGFLKEASEYSGDWSDEMRTKAGGWHKQLDPLGLAEAGQADTPVPADPESEAGPVDVEGTMEPAGGMETKALKEVFTKQADDVKRLTEQVQRLQKVLIGTGTNGTH